MTVSSWNAGFQLEKRIPKTTFITAPFQEGLAGDPLFELECRIPARKADPQDNLHHGPLSGGIGRGSAFRAEKSCNFLFTTKMVFPKSLKSTNSGSEFSLGTLPPKKGVRKGTTEGASYYSVIGPESLPGEVGRNKELRLLECQTQTKPASTYWK